MSYVITETGLTFGPSLSINRDHIGFATISTYVKNNEIDIAVKLLTVGLTEIRDMDENLNYLAQKLNDKIKKILYKYVALFLKENLEYRFCLANFIQNLLLCDDDALDVVYDKYFPITEDGRLVMMYEDKLIATLPSKWSEMDILEYFPEEEPRSILYQKEFNIRGGL